MIFKVELLYLVLFYKKIVLNDRMIVRLLNPRRRWTGATTKQMPRNNLIVKIT